MVVNISNKRLGIEFGRDEQLGADVEAARHNGPHAVDVEERQDAHVHVLVFAWRIRSRKNRKISTYLKYTVVLNQSRVAFSWQDFRFFFYLLLY